MIPMTIVGLPPMEDGYLGEAVGDAFLPVLKFQHRDLVDLFLPLEQKKKKQPSARKRNVAKKTKR